MSLLEQIALFASQMGLVLFVVIVLILLIAIIVARSKHIDETTVENLNDKFREMANVLKLQTLNKKELKSYYKAEKKRLKEEAKKPTTDKRKVYVLEFTGDIKASHVTSLRKEITMILAAARPGDEVVVLLESPGGMVHSYGLAASQLARIKGAGLKLTICVDKVAASGGYLMACLGDRILAAPFAILGSIGVIAQVPNFHRLLDKFDIDYEEITAGEYKRTVSLFGKLTEKGKDKFKEQIEDTHQLFKNFVKSARPTLNLDKVATGEHWYGQQALELGLVDEIRTSDDYLFSLKSDSDIFKISTKEKKKITEKLAEAMSLSFEKTLERILHMGRYNS